jgi:hypothetical protein
MRWALLHFSAAFPLAILPESLIKGNPTKQIPSTGGNMLLVNGFA